MSVQCLETSDSTHSSLRYKDKGILMSTYLIHSNHFENSIYLSWLIFIALVEVRKASVLKEGDVVWCEWNWGDFRVMKSKTSLEILIYYWSKGE